MTTEEKVYDNITVKRIQLINDKGLVYWTLASTEYNAQLYFPYQWQVDPNWEPDPPIIVEP